MDRGALRIASLVFAEGQLRWSPGSSGGSDQTLVEIVNDAMTSWWAQAIAIGMYAAIACLLFRSLRRRDDGSGPPVERRRARNVALGALVALAALVVLAAASLDGALDDRHGADELRRGIAPPWG